MFLSALIEQRDDGVIDLGGASDYGQWLLDQSHAKSSSGVNVTETNALTLPAAYACIKVLSETLAHVPLFLMKDGKSGPEKATRHPLFDMMLHAPSDDQTSFTWRQTLEGHRDGWGNAYAKINRQGGTPSDLEIWYPDRTDIVKLDKTGEKIYKTVNSKGETEKAFPSDILHIPGFGFDGWQGFSPIQLHKEAIGLGLAIHSFGAKFFGNGMVPKGVIETDMAPNAIKKFKDTLMEMFGGLDGALGTPVFSKGITYKPHTINPEDAQTLETLKYNRTEIAGIYRVPPQFIMDLANNTFTNAQEMDLHFIKHTMVPIFTVWEQELNRKLLTEKERRRGFYFKFDVRMIMRGAPKDRATFYHQAIQDKWIKRSEVREWEDLPIWEGVDEEPLQNEPAPAPTNQPAQDPDEPDEEENSNDIEQIKGLVQPLIKSVAERMASNERRTIERVSDDASRMFEFYDSKYPDFIKRQLSPVATMIEPYLEQSAEAFTEGFIKRYIDLQMTKEIDRSTVSESDIIKSFYEEISWNKELLSLNLN